MTRTGREIIKMLIGPVILTFFLVYTIYFEFLKSISRMFINMAPALVLVVGGLLALDQNRALFARQAVKGELEQVTTISRYDLYYVSALTFFSSALVFLLPLFFNQRWNFVDVFQSAVVLASFYWVKQRYFHYRYIPGQSGEYILDDTMIVTIIDSMKVDALAFSCSIIMVAVPGVLLQNLHITDIFQAGIAFLAFYILNVKYFELS